jgi:hypothetical protein
VNKAERRQQRAAAKAAAGAHKARPELPIQLGMVRVSTRDGGWEWRLMEL